ncbi:MAG: SPOR domain-containing protein [Roseburia sp.]
MRTTMTSSMQNMSRTADAIADGIVRTFAEQEKQTAGVEDAGLYMVQTGIYRVRSQRGEGEWNALKAQGFPAFMTFKDGLYYVRAGAFRNMENAVRQEQELRKLGYPTLLVKT